MALVEPPLTNGNHINGTNGITTPDAPTEPAIPFDPAIFRAYLLALLPPLIAATPEDVELLFDEDFDGRVTRFAGEGGGVIYIVKKKDEVEGMSEPVCHACLNA